MGCTSSKLKLNFDQMKLDESPAKENEALIAEIQALLQQKNENMAIIQERSTPPELIMAIEDSDLQILIAALTVSAGSLGTLLRLFQYSRRVAEVVVKVLAQLTAEMSSSQKWTKETLEQNIAKNWSLMKSVAQLLSAVIQIDNTKSNNKNVQNELSLIKRIFTQKDRLLSESSEGVSDPKLGILKDFSLAKIIGDLSISKLVSFYSRQAPILATCIRKISKHNESVDDSELADGMVQSLPIILYSAFEAKVVHRDDQLVFAQAMVAGALLVDHLVPEGIFYASSRLDVAGIVRLLRNEEGQLAAESGVDTKTLLRLLRFWSLHLEDERTPAKVKALFADVH